MDVGRRVVVSMPLATLWGADDRDLAGGPVADVGADRIRELLRAERELRLVIALVGEPLRWVDPPARFDVWKRELASRLAEPGQPIFLDEFADETAYTATEWRLDGGPVVVFEQHH